MRLRPPLLALAAALVATAVTGQEKGEVVKPAPSRVTAVTVYQNTALVTREVTVPAAAGLTEVVVSPLPPYTLQTSLYAEGSDGVRVLSVRYRTRAIAEDTREEVRKLDTKLKELNGKMQAVQADLHALEQNGQFLTKMEGFTTKSMEHLTDKGQLDSEKVIALAKYVQDERTKRVKDEVGFKQQIESLQEQIAFTRRQLGEKSGGAVRTERDAVIVVDKRAGGGTIRLNYLVGNASWRPQYKYRAGTKEADRVTVEYLAALEQRTGEDWSDVDLVLSTAQPLLNAAPPDLRVLEIDLSGPGGSRLTSTGGTLNIANPGGSFNGIPPPQPTAAALSTPQMPSAQAYTKDVKELERQSQQLRSQVADNYRMNNEVAANTFANGAAAIEQFRDLVVSREDIAKNDPATTGMVGEGPSVTFRLKGRLTVPSRNDEQVIEVARLDFAPRFYYKAVPVLTPNVYRLADLTNTSDHVLLPGDATMYIGTDFVGQAKLPLVAVGKPYTVGFGVDPQLQVSRKLVDRTRTTQGGNQVMAFRYRVLLSSYKTSPVPVQVWDRMPHAEAANAIAVTLANPTVKLSDDPLYSRDEKPKNLLRWDVTLEPKQNAEKALAIDYEYKMELDRNVSIGTFTSK